MLEPLGNLGGTTRLFGRIWTGGPGVVIRYYWAQRAGGKRVPICAVARKGAGQLERKPGRFPRSIELPYSNALAFMEGARIKLSTLLATRAHAPSQLSEITMTGSLLNK